MIYPEFKFDVHAQPLEHWIDSLPNNESIKVIKSDDGRVFLHARQINQVYVLVDTKIGETK